MGNQTGGPLQGDADHRLQGKSACDKQATKASGALDNLCRIGPLLGQLAALQRRQTDGHQTVHTNDPDRSKQVFTGARTRDCKCGTDGNDNNDHDRAPLPPLGDDRPHIGNDADDDMPEHVWAHCILAGIIKVVRDVPATEIERRDRMAIDLARSLLVVAQHDDLGVLGGRDQQTSGIRVVGSDSARRSGNDVISDTDVPDAMIVAVVFVLSTLPSGHMYDKMATAVYRIRRDQGSAPSERIVTALSLLTMYIRTADDRNESDTRASTARRALVAAYHYAASAPH